MSSTKTAKKSASKNEEREKLTVRRDVGRLEYLDPHDLVVDAFNHRKKRESGDATEPDAALLASVRAVGVQVPLLVRPQADGAGLGVVWGQRRLRAALAVAAEARKRGRPYALVPCLVRKDLAGADDEALMASMVENTHRAAAGERDDVDALVQLSLMEMSDGRRARYAKALGYRAAEVRAANGAAGLGDRELASALAASFDLVEAAELAEVNDVPGALDALSAAKADDRREGKNGRGHWAHALGRLRQEKAERQQRERVEAELAAAKVPVVAHRPSWSSGPARPLADLTTGLRRPLTPEAHAASCPGHAAALGPDSEPVFVCSDWRRRGHLLNQRAREDEGRRSEDRAAEAARRQHLSENEQAWRAAREVRWSFLVELCARKTASDATWQLVLSTVLENPRFYSRFGQRRCSELIARFLGVAEADRGSVDKLRQVVARTGRTRRWRPLLAQVAAAWESEVMGDRAWHAPSTELREWLGFLAAEGYTLSEIERRVSVDRVPQAQS
ncbi:ParB N-terminal domain-containing protein [Streptomyces sedi]|uniref:ParB-like N-terminal domain-containing protein n=1 Tax=Streptomyces sedi TaxID=555059 RepID=A0A5C4USK5_9ACTN|nr:ParB N-terminal domain-containing protein [Streptomyces sedi]TNM25899.1 hypothetical protein FH715_25360 [Streptomyces sedi]